MVVQWSGHLCASCSSTLRLTWKIGRFQVGIVGGHRSCFIKSFGNIEGHISAVRILSKIGVRHAVGGGSPPFALMTIPNHSSEVDSTELVVNQSQKLKAVNATTLLQGHIQGTSNATQRTSYQIVFFVKETMTYLADNFGWVWGICIVKPDPRAKFIISWICNGIRLVFICPLGFIEVVVVEKTGGILTISKEHRIDK